MQPVPDVSSRSAVPDSPIIAPWHEIVQATLKRNDVKLVAYVPDTRLNPRTVAYRMTGHPQAQQS